MPKKGIELSHKESLRSTEPAPTIYSWESLGSSESAPGGTNFRWFSWGFLSWEQWICDGSLGIESSPCSTARRVLRRPAVIVGARAGVVDESEARALDLSIIKTLT